MGAGGALKKTLDDFTGKDGYQISVDPRLFSSSSSSSGKFSNVTPGRKPEYYTPQQKESKEC